MIEYDAESGEPFEAENEGWFWCLHCCRANFLQGPLVCRYCGASGTMDLWPWVKLRVARL